MQSFFVADIELFLFLLPEIDGIVGLLHGLGSLLPASAIELLNQEPKNNDLHEAAASLTNLFAVTSQ